MGFNSGFKGLTPLANIHFLLYAPLFSGLMSIGWLRPTTQTPNHSIIYYGNTIFYWRLYY